MRRGIVIVLIAAFLTGCAGVASRLSGALPPTPSSAGPPAADAPLPATSAGLASALASTTTALEADIRRWQRSKPPIGARPPQSVTLRALYQQRILRRLRLHQALAARVIAAMPARLRSQAADNVAAGRALFRLAPRKTPKTQPPIRTGRAEAPGRLLGWYRAAEKRFRVRWQVLAAVNFVESGFNRLRNGSYAGAQGPMQFIPATWQAYGLGGDIHDPHDAIMGAANYLHASGAPASYRQALLHYNPSPLYVDAILRYARQMQRRPERYYAYWSWQVFVRGKRLTGPGRPG